MPPHAQALAAAEDLLAAIDREIEAKERALAALVARRAVFAAGDDDFSRRCTALLGDAYRTEQMRVLRERATRTPSAEDDAAVDALTAIRADLPRVTDEVQRYRVREADPTFASGRWPRGPGGGPWHGPRGGWGGGGGGRGGGF